MAFLFLRVVRFPFFSFFCGHRIVKQSRTTFKIVHRRTDVTTWEKSFPVDDVGRWKTILRNRWQIEETSRWRESRIGTRRRRENLNRGKVIVRRLVRGHRDIIDLHSHRARRDSRGMVFLASAISLIPPDTLRSILPVIATNPIHGI